MRIRYVLEVDDGEPLLQDNDMLAVNRVEFNDDNTIATVYLWRIEG